MASVIRRNALQSSSSDESTVSALATTLPGRIYAIARSFKPVAKLSLSFAALSPSKVRPLLPEDTLKVLKLSPSSHIRWSWARVRGRKSKCGWYVGDTGFITQVEGRNKNHLALIPRLALNSVGEGQSRPPLMLVSRRRLEALGRVKDELYGRFVWKGQTFSGEGFLLVDLDDISILASPDTLPSSAELDVFRSTSLLSAVDVEKITQKISQARLNTGDRVKVVSGPYLHLIGEVKAITENEVAVFLPSQDITEDMPKDTVRATFRVADQVRVIDGQRQGLVGWVTAISDSEHKLCVVNVEAAIEVVPLIYEPRRATDSLYTGHRLHGGRGIL